MEYQDIVTEYKDGSLDVSELKEKMEIARLLEGRSELRAVGLVDKRSSLNFNNQSMLLTPETPERFKRFAEECDEALEKYFEILINSIRSTKAWRIIKLNPKEYTIDNFRKSDKSDQFRIIQLLNRRYYQFLNYQRVADISNLLKNSSNLDDVTLKKILFLNNMFEAFGNEEIKSEFFSFSKSIKFLNSLIEFRKNKTQKIDEFMKTKSKSVKKDYERFSKFFSTEDFRNIAENLELTSKTLKIPVKDVIYIFREMSEGLMEQKFLEDEYEVFQRIEEKFFRMYELKKNMVTQVLRKRISESNSKPQLKGLRNNLNEKQEIVENSKSQADKFNCVSLVEKSTKLNKTNLNIKKGAKKELVIPIIFTWLEREDIPLGRRVGLKNLISFLEQVRQEEINTGARASLFLITNANKEVTLKRMGDIKKRAKVKGMHNLVEGALGGYSTFRIDSDGNIADIAIMSETNRIKIIKLMETSSATSILNEKIDNEEKNYVRYVFSSKKDKSITINSLNQSKKRIMENPQIKKQPIEVLPFMEGKYSGLDVVLKTQLVGMFQLPNYYKSKYRVATGKTIKIDINMLSEFTDKSHQEPDEK